MKRNSTLRCCPQGGVGLLPFLRGLKKKLPNPGREGVREEDRSLVRRVGRATGEGFFSSAALTENLSLRLRRARGRGRKRGEDRGVGHEQERGRPSTEGGSHLWRGVFRPGREKGLPNVSGGGLVLTARDKQGTSPN